MRRVLSATFVAVLALGLMSACNGDDDDNPFADGSPRVDASDIDAAVVPDGGAADAAGADALAMIDAPFDEQGPVVAVTAPTEPDDFTAGEILTTARFTAKCTASANAATGSPVDPASVTITAFGAGVERQELAQPTTVDNEYVADMVVSDFPNGWVTIRCTASDSEIPARTNSHEIHTYLDLGPNILVLGPLDDASYANQIGVSFKVSAYPVDAADDLADPDFDSVEVWVAGVDITADIPEDGATAGLYQGTVTFDDSRFDPSLDGPNTLTITAPNERGVTRTRNVVFIADSDGPQIEITEPAPGDFIAGIFTLTADVSDPAGVDDLSVVATIAGTHEFSLESTGDDTYEGSFDTRVLPHTMVFPTIVLRAQDVVGNQSSVGMLVTLDNQPPLISLDPPDMREYKWNGDIEEFECSWMFDPLGGWDPLGLDPDYGDAADDGQTVAQLSELRARVEDRGNQALSDSGVLIPLAEVDQTSVELFILDHAEGALLVDTDDDGYCDEINPLLEPTSVPWASDEAAVINLVPLEPAGSSFFFIIPDPETAAQPAFQGSGPESDLDGLGHGCYDGTATTEPDPLCVTSPGTRITQTALGALPVIYTIPPVTEHQCYGNPFDSLATNISDGWACLAVRATDNLGNVGISAPLRICFDHDGDGGECPAMGTITTSGLEDCTGIYDPETDTVDADENCTLSDTPARSWLYEDYPWRQVRRIDL
jgi:hypothetical protein